MPKVLKVTSAINPHFKKFLLLKSINSTKTLKKLRAFPWFSRVTTSKFEANRSRGSLVMIGHTNKQTVKQRLQLYTGCPNTHGNSVTNSISSLLWISIVIPNFKSHNKYNRMQSKHKQKNCKHSRRKSYGLQLSQ